jgi:hypothetical protein
MPFAKDLGVLIEFLRKKIPDINSFAYTRNVNVEGMTEWKLRKRCRSLKGDINHKYGAHALTHASCNPPPVIRLGARKIERKLSRIYLLHFSLKLT